MPRSTRKPEQPEEWLPGRIELSNRDYSEGGVQGQNTPFPPAPPKVLEGTELPDGWKPGQPLHTHDKS